MRGYGEYMGDKKRIDRIETKDLEARGMEVAAMAGSTIRILTIYAIYAIVVSTSNGQLSIQMSSSFFSCDDTGFFHEDRFHEDLVYLLYVLTTMMSSYCAKLCVRINVQLFGFYIPTIIGSIMSFLLSGPSLRYCYHFEFRDPRTASSE